MLLRRKSNRKWKFVKVESRFIWFRESLCDEDTSCQTFIQFQRQKTDKGRKKLESSINICVDTKTDRNRESISNWRGRQKGGKKSCREWKTVWKGEENECFTRIHCIVVYYISELIQDAKRNVIRQNCSLLLCVFGWQPKENREKEIRGESSHSDDAACFLCSLLPRWEKRTILSNRIHVSIRDAIVVFNSKLPTTSVSVCSGECRFEHGKLWSRRTHCISFLCCHKEIRRMSIVLKLSNPIWEATSSSSQNISIYFLLVLWKKLWMEIAYVQS